MLRRGLVITDEALNVTEGSALVANKLASGERIVVDLFGGKTSQVEDAINIDIIAESGIKASVKDLTEIFPPNSVDEIIVSGPKAPFLSVAAQVLKPGGRIYINASKGNKFGKVPDPETRLELGDSALEQLGLRILQNRGKLDNRFAVQSFLRSDGIPIPSKSVKTTILEKI